MNATWKVNCAVSYLASFTTKSLLFPQETSSIEISVKIWIFPFLNFLTVWNEARKNTVFIFDRSTWFGMLCQPSGVFPNICMKDEI